MSDSDIGTLIVKSPETLGDRPRIAVTRVSGLGITAWYKDKTRILFTINIDWGEIEVYTIAIRGDIYK
ncbi:MULTISPECIES: hypothetical protein [unclassified Nostoc]|uniref:hypothetical protein n=1 Tax=unclassified Nostoc TaxID=2593658 RepID=UPI002622AEE2|nr:hypothetical protein [Nostoc sp. S13]MDF5738655.1 hypothetical protein [Nostoc sp. S13]